MGLEIIIKYLFIKLNIFKKQASFKEIQTSCINVDSHMGIEKFGRFKNLVNWVEFKDITKIIKVTK